MVMKILEAGGLQPLTDEIRKPDEDNPKGYYEFEPVKALRKNDFSWLPDAQGRCVKVIATLLPYLPDSHSYQVIFVHRQMLEILASQRKMLVNRGEDPDKVSDDDMARIFDRHLEQVKQWLHQRPNVRHLDVNYNQMLVEPLPDIERINQFLGGSLNTESMIRVIDLNLYRQRMDSTTTSL